MPYELHVRVKMRTVTTLIWRLHRDARHVPLTGLGA